MTRWLSSLTNRIFLSGALLAVLVLGIAISVVNGLVSAQAERDLQRGLREAAALVDHYRDVLLSNLAQQARLIADLPKFKASVDTEHPPTVRPVAADYRRQIAADLFVVLGRSGGVLATEGNVPPGLLARLATPGPGPDDRATIFWADEAAVLQTVVVPVWIDPAAPQLLGRLAVGAALDSALAARMKSLTDADIAFWADGAVRASTLPPGSAPLLARWMARPAAGALAVDGEQYVALAQELRGSGGSRASVIVLRSRTEHLRLLGRLRIALAATGVVAVLLATLLGYAVARTITRPLGAITQAVRDMAATGDLTHRVELPDRSLLLDEDARVLATTLNTMTASIAAFQREAAQRERLSALGRLSTVIAHEIRNPLMIIKAALRTLRRDEVGAERGRQAVRDIDEEVDRLNRLVHDVLDFTRPVRIEFGEASLSTICRGAAAAAFAGAEAVPCRLALDDAADGIVTDAERLRQALVNLLVNARQAVEAQQGIAASQDRAAAAVEPSSAGPAREGRVIPFGSAWTGPPTGPGVHLTTCAVDDDRVRILVCDTGAGIAAEDRPRIFEPYFTTRRTGSGLGLAITRNIVEGLGGSIAVESTPGEGTEIRIDLPRSPRPSTAQPGTSDA